MKNKIIFKFLMVLGVAFIAGFVNADKNYVHEIIAWQQEMNTEFSNPKETPLDSVDFSHFKALAFYPIDITYRVKAKLVLQKQSKPFGMKTTTSRLPVYVKYGKAYFTLKGHKLQINIYQNVEFAKKEKYKDYLFMLFTDLSSGKTSYGGGRYIDLRKPQQGDSLIIDFNKAYNPYCAYSHKWSCPIPPADDHFNIAILAGIKKWH